MSSEPHEQERAAESGGLTRRSSSTGLALVVLCGIILAFYDRLWIPDLVLIKRDAFRMFLPSKHYMVERLSSGQLPEWFPYEALGRSFIGSTITGVFHPFTALYFLLPVPDAYRAATLISCLLAGLGAFVLGRALKYSRTGAVTAGLAFALSGYVVSMTENLPYLYAICMLPLFFATLAKALTGGSTWVAAASAIWASVFLNGDVQNGYYYGFAAALWTTAQARGAYRTASGKLACIVGLTMLLAAAQLGPASATFLSSHRTQPQFFQVYALDRSTHPLRLLTMVAWPNTNEQLTDQATEARVFFGLLQFSPWAESLYVGIPVMGLALVAAWRRRDLWGFTLLGSLALWLSLGRYGGLYELLCHTVPLWSAFRYPEKLMGFASFSIAMLAGAGLDSVRNERGHPTTWLIGAVFCAGIGLLLHTGAARESVASRFGASADLAGDFADTTGLSFLLSAAAASGVGLAVIAAKKEWIRSGVFASALVGLIVIDLAGANGRAYHTAPREAATFLPPLADALRAQEKKLSPGHFRLVTLLEPAIRFPLAIQPLFGFQGVNSVRSRQALENPINAEFGLESFGASLPGWSSALDKIVFFWIGLDGYARFNVRYLIGSRNRAAEQRLAANTVAVIPTYDLALFHNPVPVKPRAYLSRKPERVAAPVDPIALLARPDFLSGEVDVIETTDTALPGLALDGHAFIERYEPEEIRVRVETPQPAVLVLLDAFDAGWRAALETGTDLPIMRANALVRAVSVPAGTHVVTFIYRTPFLAAGIWLSSAGLLLGFGLIIYDRRRARRHVPPPVREPVSSASTH